MYIGNYFGGYIGNWLGYSSLTSVNSNLSVDYNILSAVLTNLQWQWSGGGKVIAEFNIAWELYSETDYIILQRGCFMIGKINRDKYVSLWN